MNNESEAAFRVVQARAGGAVERSHTFPHHGSYSVAAHSWGVAMLMRELWPADFPRLAAACLCHDVAEAWIGDIPAPAKRLVPGLSEKLTALEASIERDLGLPILCELSPEDARKVKACDCLEFYLWSREQINLGNVRAHEGLREVSAYLEETWVPWEAYALYRELETRSICPDIADFGRRIADEC